MLDTDYPNPPSQNPAAPPAPATSLANLTGRAHCFILFSAKKRARQTLFSLVSRLKTLRRTRVRSHRDLSRGEPRGEVLG